MYSEDDFERFRSGVTPEILRVPLGETILKLLERGIDAVNFDWLDKPSEEAFRAAITELVRLGALEDPANTPAHVSHSNRLTDFGRFVVRVDLEPRLARVLYMGVELGLCDTACSIAGLLSTDGGNVWFRGGDQKRKQRADEQRSTLLRRLGVCNADSDILASVRVLEKFLNLDKDPSEAGNSSRTKADDDDDDAEDDAHSALTAEALQALESSFGVAKIASEDEGRARCAALCCVPGDCRAHAC